MVNLTIRVITSSSVNAYVMIGDTLTLCNVKFESINTLSGKVSYMVTPKGENEGKVMKNIVAYNSVKDFEEDVRIEEEFSL